MTDEDSRSVDTKIASLGDWRGEILSHLRALVREADPDVIEEIKWRKPTNPLGVIAWSHAGLIATGETYRNKVKITFAKGAALPDAASLFNASLDGGTRRAIDLAEDDSIDEEAFKALIRDAIALNIEKR